MKKLKSKIAIVSLILVIMIITIISVGCGKEDNSSIDKQNALSQNSTTSSTRTVVDGNGNNVTIPYKVDKIAAGGALNQVVLLVGGADKLVATAEYVQKGLFPKVYPRIKEIPAAYAGSGGGTLNVETILQANPQVVFGGTTGLGDQEKLKESKIAFLGLKMETPEDIKNTVSMVGKVLGKESEERSKKFNEYYDNNLKYVRDRTKSAEKVKVFAATGSPKGAITTIAANDINSSYIEAAGGINIVAEKFPKAPANAANVSVDFEFLYKNQPDVITVRSKDMYDYIMNSNSQNQWQSLNAVKNKRVYLEPKGVYLWSVRSAEGALQPLWLAKNLHPDLFKDLDINKKVKDYYKTYYNYDLSDSDLKDILNPKN
jgi:iron complex transport system substrate-binding protein